MEIPNLERLIATTKDWSTDRAQTTELLPMLFLVSGKQVDILGSEGRDIRLALRRALEENKPQAYVLLMESRMKEMPANREGLIEARRYQRGDLQKDPEAQDCLMVYGVENGGRSICWVAGIEGECPQRTVLPWRQISKSGVDLGQMIVREW